MTSKTFFEVLSPQLLMEDELDLSLLIFFGDTLGGARNDLWKVN